MTLDQQVISLPLAKRLKELGVKQQSFFAWGDVKRTTGIRSELIWPDIDEWEGSSFDSWVSAISAFTVAELGEILPAQITAMLDGYEILFGLECHKNAGWTVKYVSYKQTGIGYILGGYGDIDRGSVGGVMHHESEAEALGLMLAYLIENKLITV